MAPALLLIGCAGGGVERTNISGSGRLVVHVEVPSVAQGSVVLALFASPSDFDSETDPVATERRPATEATAEWTVTALPFGDYAVKAYQDLNDNGRLDRTRVGIPTEPYGFSNDARGRFGPPPFSEARFAHAATLTEITISLR